jgi:hypothetical protein
MTIRKLIAASLFLLPTVALGATMKKATPATTRAAAVRSLPKGSTFTSGGEQYRMLGGARVVTRAAHETVAKALARARAAPRDVIERKGNFLVVRDPKAPATALAPEDDRARLPVAVNTRTGQLGVVSGVINTLLAQGVDAAAVAQAHGLTLVSAAPRIGAAFFRAPAGQDLQAAAAALAADANVASAEVEVIERVAVPH